MTFSSSNQPMALSSGVARSRVSCQGKRFTPDLMKNFWRTVLYIHSKALVHLQRKLVH